MPTSTLKSKVIQYIKTRWNDVLPSEIKELLENADDELKQLSQYEAFLVQRYIADDILETEFITSRQAC